MASGKPVLNKTIFSKNHYMVVVESELFLKQKMSECLPGNTSASPCRCFCKRLKTLYPASGLASSNRNFWTIQPFQLALFWVFKTLAMFRIKYCHLKNVLFYCIFLSKKCSLVEHKRLLFQKQEVTTFDWWCIVVFWTHRFTFRSGAGTKDMNSSTWPTTSQSEYSAIGSWTFCAHRNSWTTWVMFRPWVALQIKQVISLNL